MQDKALERILDEQYLATWASGKAIDRTAYIDYIVKVGGAEEDRTPDLCIANAALSQLSYGPRGCQCTPRPGRQIIRNHAYIPTRPGFVRRQFCVAYAWRDSRANIASSLSRSGISGNSLIILTRHNTGASSGQPSVVCSSRTSLLTRTSCGNPCVSTPK